MKEISMLEGLGSALDPVGPPPQDLRRRVLSEALQSRSQRWWFGSRLGVRVAMVGGLAAVVTAVVLALQVVPFGSQGPAARAEAADILHAAAVQASHQTDLRVRPEQFIWVESIATVRATNEATRESAVESVRRTVWLSADGTKDGLIRQESRPGGTASDIVVPGCKDGVMTQSKGSDTGTSSCKPSPAYVADLPTDADTMLNYLYHNVDGTKNPRDQEAFSTAANLIREAYLRPASLSALFTAVAKIPGVTVVGDVTDEAGRKGVAISLNEVQDTRTDLIFDRNSHAYIGTRTVMATGADGLHAGDLLYSAAVLSIKVVDRVGG